MIDAYDPRFDEIFRRLEPDERTDRMKSEPCCRPVACQSSGSPATLTPLAPTLASAVESLEDEIVELRKKLGPVLKPHPWGSALGQDDDTQAPMRSTLRRLYAAISDLRATDAMIDL